MNNELLANKTFNTETSRTGMLIPAMLRTDASALNGFLEEYYRLSNATGNATNLINDFLREHDIDSVTEQFFSGIQNLIAKNIPNSKFDRQTLYKRIIDYYSMRGSENSVKAFFKIFFNEEVLLYYPKNDLLKPSDGNFPDEKSIEHWNTARNLKITLNDTAGYWIMSNIDYSVPSSESNTFMVLDDADYYLNTNGFLSNSRLKLQDSEYWQDFSYEIQLGLTDNIWKNDYLNLVHPAGLKYFQRIVITISTSNTWIIDWDYKYDSEDIFNMFTPPKSGDHSPGGLQYFSVFKDYIPPISIIITYVDSLLISRFTYFELDDTMSHGIVNIIMMSLIDVADGTGDYYGLSQLTMNSTDFMNYLKFMDQSAISGYSDNNQPVEFDRNYSLRDGSLNDNAFPPVALGSIITLTS